MGSVSGPSSEHGVPRSYVCAVQTSSVEIARDYYSPTVRSNS
jgi:hypothetical protein